MPISTTWAAGIPKYAAERGIALHERVHGFTPHPHARNIGRWNDRLAPDVVGYFFGSAAVKSSLLDRLPHRIRHQWALHEAEMENYARNARREVPNGNLLVLFDRRALQRLHRHQQHTLRQRVDMLEMMAERKGNAHRPGCKERCRSRNAHRRMP